MIDVMSKTFLGVTVACARCHDHKFDAISTADYYALSGYLQSSNYRQVRFESLEQNRQVANQLANLDARYQTLILERLKQAGLQPPSQVSYLTDESVLFDYSRMPQSQYLQEGYVYGPSARQQGLAYMDAKTGEVTVETGGWSTNVPIWDGIESITEGSVRNQNALAKLPKSGRTLRSPTFELENGRISCLVKGTGHVGACVDSHRLIVGPLHNQTIVPVHEGQRWVTLNLQRYVGHRLHLEFIPASDAQLSVRLVTQGLTDQQLGEIDHRLANLDKPFQEYANRANEFLKRVDQANIKSLVFEDFESGSYDGWTVTGEAFGKIPRTAKKLSAKLSLGSRRR
ncbi:hypothetical protein SV7mr_24870 [Stieleria bergensis]|uniref:DUF1549 domain-containing protein n=2 Tax=Stieleria bergensis TaxID=2528025 RepID=A0A517SV47_9BACT|nr:hypothetical protein SV7mr_24870 [Planctomycetes bacterium SV_7m_r]